MSYSRTNLCSNLPYKITITCRNCRKKFKCGDLSCYHWQQKEVGYTCICANFECFGGYNHGCKESIEPTTPPLARIGAKFIGTRVLQ